nr:MAG TPA: hypothetical protein [Corticoviridae sp.]
MRCDLGRNNKCCSLSRARMALREVLSPRKHRRAPFGGHRKFKQNLRGNLGGNENFPRF